MASLFAALTLRATQSRALPAKISPLSSWIGFRIPTFFHAVMVAVETPAMIASWRCVMRVDVFLSRVLAMPQICEAGDRKSIPIVRIALKLKFRENSDSLLLSVEFGLSSRESGGKPGATTNQRGKA